MWAMRAIRGSVKRSRPLRVRTARGSDQQLDVTFEAAGVDVVQRRLERRHRIDDELGLAPPPAVDGGLPDPRGRRHTFHGQAVVAVADQ
jgi:hypothetical protein